MNSTLKGDTGSDLIPLKLSVASTFTSNPIEDVLEFWGKRFGYRTVVHFSPYDQVFQELLDSTSTLNHPGNDARLIFLKMDDWVRNLSHMDESAVHDHIMDNIHSLCEYAETSAADNKTPLFLTIARNVDCSVISPSRQKEYEQLIKDGLSAHSTIFVTTSGEIDKIYPVDNYYDVQRDKLGHIPFKSEYFTALATYVFRRVLADKRSPYKVIALDCDNTLWEGACGEVGPEGICLSEPHSYLQSFMLRQMKSGKILCLCSKNVQEDVDNVFSGRADLLIRKEDIVSSRVNWQPKSRNIRELAEELDLGLDSFIFVDDNPVECAEVRANCPEVLTLNLPERPEQISTFLNHIWPFDCLKSTGEDEKRTKLYKDNIKRSGVKNASSSLKEFIESLNLDISINDVLPEEISRVSQLSYRVNQFNFTTIRRSEKELEKLLATEGFECKVCKVRDRFGDYGLVGAMLYQPLTDRIVLDSFMLSCRVLGRGVEYKMLRSVSETARAYGLDTVQINFTETEKNLPALNFLQSVFEIFSDDISLTKEGYIVPTVYLNELRYEPDSRTPEENRPDDQKKKPVSKTPTENHSLIFEQIARNLDTPSKINRFMNSNGISAADKAPMSSETTDGDSLQIITEIWENILGRSGIDPDQPFFDAGGTSLKAVEVLQQLNEQFNKNLTIVSLFEHSTIHSLVELVEGKAADNSEFDKIMKRAGSRRDRFRRRV